MKTVAWMVGITLFCLNLSVHAVEVSHELGFEGMLRVYKSDLLRGKVVRVDKIPGGNGWSNVHLLLATANGEYLIIVGPSWYLENKNVKIHVGEEITVTGYKEESRNSPVVMAQEIMKGSRVIKLRDGNGVSLWGRNDLRGW